MIDGYRCIECKSDLTQTIECQVIDVEAMNEGHKPKPYWYYKTVTFINCNSCNHTCECGAKELVEK